MTLDIVKELLAENLECDPESIAPETEFKSLGLDSLDLVEMVMKLEDKVGCELELNQKLLTVGDLVAFIESKQG